MTEEKNKALIEWLKEGIELREEYGFNGNLLASMRVALTALTAPPVKLPGKCKVSDRAHETRQAYAEGLNHGIELARKAIAEAGYQVQGE